MAEWCGQFSTKFYSKWSRFSHRSPKSTDFEEQTSRKYRKKGDVFFALVWSNKRINQHLGLPKRFAPGIRLHRKAEKSVHFLPRWLGTPSPKMKSIRGNQLTPISSILLGYAFQGVFDQLSGQAASHFGTAGKDENLVISMRPHVARPRIRRLAQVQPI